MALNYGSYELDRYIPGLAQDFQKYADENFKSVERLSKYEKLAIAENYLMIELTEESLKRFVKLTEEYMA